MSIARDHPLSAPAHHPSFDLFCHRHGRRRNHRLLRSKMKTEPYRNRGFFLKTEPKSTDLAKCETVTTLGSRRWMHRKHGIDRGTEVTEGSRAWGGYHSGSGVPPPLEKLQRTANTIVLPLIFGIWFGIFPISTARRPSQLQSTS